MYGAFTTPQLPYAGVPLAFRSQWGSLLGAPGSNVHYVRSTGAADYDPPELSGRIHATVVSAMAQCRSGRGDIILVLPGHTESVSSADHWSALVAGTQIIGVGRGSARPTFNWTAADAQAYIDVADVSITNCTLNLAGDPTATTALTVAAPILISAPGCTISQCIINSGVDADQIVTIGIGVGLDTGTDEIDADHFTFAYNRVWNGSVSSTGTRTLGTAAEITAGGTFMRLCGADFATIVGNQMVASLATDTDGVIESKGTLSSDILIADNYIYSNGAGSTCAVDFGAALACTGLLKNNVLHVVADGTATTVAYTAHATVVCALQDNYMVNNVGERGLVIGTASV